MVGASSLLGGDDSGGASDSKKVILGMGLIVFAQACPPGLRKAPHRPAEVPHRLGGHT